MTSCDQCYLTMETVCVVCVCMYVCVPVCMRMCVCAYVCCHKLICPL